MKNNSSLFMSVVIPCYNRAKGVTKTLASLIAQDYHKEFEIIIIDDGSMDSSADVCHEFLKKYDIDYQIIQQENAGVSAARNAGIKVARGEYLYFLDAEDFVESNFLETIKYSNKKENLDVVIFGYDIKNTTNETLYQNQPKANSYLGIDALKAKLVYTLQHHMCSIVFRTELIRGNNLNFSREFSFGEDHEFCNKAIFHAKKVQTLPQILFHYLKTEESVTEQKYSLKRLTSIAANESMCRYILDRTEEKELQALLNKQMKFSFYMSYAGFLATSHQSENSDITEFFLNKKPIYRNIKIKASSFIDYIWMVKITIINILPGIYPLIARTESESKRLLEKIK